MDNIALKQYLQNLFPEGLFPENRQYTELVTRADKWTQTAALLKDNPDLQFDFMISITAVDWLDHFMIVCHLTSTSLQHIMVLKTRIDDRINPEVDSLSGIWKTAEFHEREMLDLFGISFKNHPDPRRLFLDDNYGYPLRKDFTDELRMIVR